MTACGRGSRAAAAPVLCCCCCRWPKLCSYLVVRIFLQLTGCFWVQPHSGMDKNKCKARCKEMQGITNGLWAEASPWA